MSRQGRERFFSGGDMGIRFYCPNGHRLNVKDFQAGKRGICPRCEARFRIPLESEISGGAPRIQPGSTAAQGELPGDGSGINGKRYHLPAATMGTREASAPNGFDPEMAIPLAVGSPASPVDPIAAAPEAVWYVRPPTGGQYGPAQGDVMRRWIEEGRVSSDSLIWREGWPDWQAAGPVFPELKSAYTTTANNESVSLHLQPDAADQPAPQLVSTQPMPRPANFRQPIVAVAILAVLIVALAVGLVIVLTAKH